MRPPCLVFLRPNVFISLILIAALHAIAASPGSAQVPRPDAVSHGAFAAGWQQGTPASAVGELTVMYADDFANRRGERLYFVRDERTGHVVQIQFEKPPAGLRTGAHVQFIGRTTDSQLYVAAGQVETSTTTSTSTAPVALTTTTTAGTTADPTVGQRTLVMIGNFTDLCVTCTANAIADTMFTDPNNVSVSALYQASSLGQVKPWGEVVGPYPINFTSTGTCDIGAWAGALDAQATASGMDLSAYARRMYVLPKNSCFASGYGTIGGSPTSAWIFTCDIKGVFAHELGHNLGMDHASSPTSEYDDSSDPMGMSTTVLPGVNAPHRAQLAWLGTAALRQVTQSGLIDVAPLAADPAVVGAPQVLMLRKPDTGDYYYLSFREPVAFDQYIDGRYYDRISVHRYKGDGSPSKTYVLARLADGEQFSDPVNGITIQLVSHTSASATVSVSLGCAPSAPSLLLSPGSQSAAPGATLVYAATLANHDTATCGASTYGLAAAVPAGWAAAVSPTALSLAPGTSGQVTLAVTAPATAALGTASVSLAASDTTQPLHAATASANFVVGDTQPPTVPTGLRASVNQKRKQIQLSWTGSTDNVAVSGYRIAKNGLVAGTSATTSWYDPAYAGGTYTVSAYDAAGNVSAQSVAVTVTLSGGGRK